MSEHLPQLIRVAGGLHFGILIASALVPFRLNWRKELAGLPKLHVQMYLVYGGYIVLCIVAFGLVSLSLPDELASGSPLARCVCGFVAVFWGVRVCLQPVFDSKPHLTTWWLRAGYHTLTALFLLFTAVYGYAAVGRL